MLFAQQAGSAEPYARSTSLCSLRFLLGLLFHDNLPCFGPLSQSKQSQQADERGVNQSWQRGNNRALVMCRPNNSGSFAIFAAIRRAVTSPNWQSGKLEEGRTQGQFRAAQVPR
jgi:hypothetical protein